uniref:SH3 domain-containing protein n=1 Tax=Zonotrichia albicollis TaxID=44394 RepID=A0A8D2NC94_ZONAL
MEAIAKYDFKATADDELSFKRGDILKSHETLPLHLVGGSPVPSPSPALSLKGE